MIAILMLGTFVSSLSQNMLAPAMVDITEEFRVTSAQTQLLTTSYTVVSGILMVALAQLIKKVNTRTLFCVSELIFLIGCTITLLAQNFYLVLLGRILQACGAGIMMPLLTTITLMIYPREYHGRAMGLIGLVTGVSPALAPTAAGFFVDWWGWRSIFLVLIGFTVIAVISGIFLVYDVSQNDKQPIQIPWLIIYGLASCSLMVSSTNIKQYGIVRAQTVVPLAVSLVMFAVFAKAQLKLKDPLMDVKLFTNRTFTMGSVLSGVTYSMMLSQSMIFPLYVQNVLGCSAAVSGMVMLPGTIMFALFSPVAGQLFDRIRPQITISLSLLLMIAGCVLGIFFLGENTELWWVSLVFIVRVIGIDLLINPLSAYAVSKLPPEELAQGTSVSSSIRQLLSALLTSVFVVIVSSISANGVIDTHGMHVSFGSQALVLLVSLIVFVCLSGEKSQRIGL